MCHAAGVPTAWLIRASRDNHLAPAFEQHGMVALGWSGIVGDLRKLSRWEVVDRLERAGVSSADEDADQLITFRDQVMGGDYVVTPDAGRSTILVGQVTGGYDYLESSHVVDEEGDPHQHIRDVTWWGHGSRSALPEHLRKQLSIGSLSIARLGGSGEWPRIIEAIRDAPPPLPRPAAAPRSSSPRVRVSSPRAAAAPKAPAPPTHRVCPRCSLQKPMSQFVKTSEVCADCRADE